MFSLFTTVKTKILKFKVSYHRFFEGDVVVVWVNKQAIQPAHAKTTLEFLQKHFKKHHVVIASSDHEKKPVFVSRGSLASKFYKHTFEDFSWYTYTIELKDEKKPFGF